mmetsp:Transcript_15491/g.40103  ORF Transcript_15491/g.40103 Transcript_15491/m.40103 type:complete len:120 (+) Transcript_15491:3206-3565(+)
MRCNESVDLVLYNVVVGVLIKRLLNLGKWQEPAAPFAWALDHSSAAQTCLAFDVTAKAFGAHLVLQATRGSEDDGTERLPANDALVRPTDVHYLRLVPSGLFNSPTHIPPVLLEHMPAF